ncbi:MAG: hypothetical protein AVDCRST_MAG36-674, partial [uncultured Nocardioidaceae bacterium]
CSFGSWRRRSGGRVHHLPRTGRGTARTAVRPLAAVPGPPLRGGGSASD